MHLVVEFPGAHVAAIRNLALIKCLRGKVADERVHPILDGQHRLLVATLQKTFKEGTSEVSLHGVVTVSGRWQLVLVTDENNALRIQVEGDHA